AAVPARRGGHRGADGTPGRAQARPRCRGGRRVTARAARCRRRRRGPHARHPRRGPRRGDTGRDLRDDAVGLRRLSPARIDLVWERLRANPRPLVLSVVAVALIGGFFAIVAPLFNTSGAAAAELGGVLPARATAGKPLKIDIGLDNTGKAVISPTC